MADNQVNKDKECKICNEVKPLTEYYKTKGNSYHSYCNDCMRDYKKQKMDKGYKPPKPKQKPKMLQRDNFNGLF